MRLLNTLSILLALGLGSRIFAMDDGSFRCKVSIKETERSLPAGTDLSANITRAVVAAPKVDSKVRAEKLAELRYSPGNKDGWSEKKKLIKNAIEKFGISPNEITAWDPLREAARYSDEKFAAYLIEQGIDINKAKGLGLFSSLGFAKLMIQKGTNVRRALQSVLSLHDDVSGPFLKGQLYQTFYREPKLALLYYKYGANPAAANIFGSTGLAQLIMINKGISAKRADLAKILVAIGVPLNSKIVYGPYKDCGYAQLLEIVNMLDSDKKELREAIDEAIQKKVAAQAQGLPIITKELAYHFRSGPRQIEDIVKSYLGELISDDVLRQIDEVDREADQMLLEINARSRADKGDEKESTTSNCVIM